MSTVTFPIDDEDVQLVAYGQPTRQSMVDEMEAAGAQLEFHTDWLHYLTVRYAGAELHYQALGGYPIARAYRDWQAVKQLVDEGVTILCDRTSSQAFRVRVQVKFGRSMIFNDHTTSTSGYPLRRAAEKYLAWRKRGDADELEPRSACVDDVVTGEKDGTP